MPDLDAEENQVGTSEQLRGREQEDRVRDDGANAECDRRDEWKCSSSFPRTLNNPARRPRDSVRPMTNSTLGPGMAITITDAIANARRAWGVGTIRSVRLLMVIAPCLKYLPESVDAE